LLSKCYLLNVCPHHCKDKFSTLMQKM